MDSRTTRGKEIAERPMEYVLSNGDEMRLTINMVKRFLVRGKPELVSEQEIFFFMHVCKARRLNPFTNDCYLIKYSNEPAAVVTSVDYFRRNARRSKDCKGWQAGIITINPDNVLRYSKGIILPGERLIGGWFKAQPEGWTEPFEHEVPLDPFIKKTREGKPTQFWRPENQPVMIRKVAECQGIRFLWGENTSGMYAAEEVVGDPINLEVKRIENTREKTDGLYNVTHQAPPAEKPSDEKPAETKPDETGKAPEGEKTAETTEYQAEDPTVEMALRWCKDNEPLSKYFKGKPPLRNVEIAAVALGIEFGEKDLPRVVHTEIRRRMQEANALGEQTAKDMEADAAGTEADSGQDPGPENDQNTGTDEQQQIDQQQKLFALMSYYNEATVKCETVPGFKALFGMATAYAGMSPGSRPQGIEQAEKFKSKLEELSADLEEPEKTNDENQTSETSIPKDRQVEEKDPAQILNNLATYMGINHPNIDLHRFKNFIGLRANQAGVPSEYTAEKFMTDSVYENQFLENYEAWEKSF